MRRRTAVPTSLLVATLLAGCAQDDRIWLPSAAQPCPPWSYLSANTHANRASPQLDCANTVNLRAMIDRPEDLAEGRPPGPATGEREARAVEAYRQGKLKPLPSSEAATPILQWPGLSGGPTQ